MNEKIQKSVPVFECQKMLTIIYIHLQLTYIHVTLLNLTLIVSYTVTVANISGVNPGGQGSRPQIWGGGSWGLHEILLYPIMQWFPNCEPRFPWEPRTIK